MTKTIGVIGLGSIGMSHAKNLIKLGHKVYGYDSDITRSQMLVDAGGKGADLEDTIKNTDAFVVASPTKTHANYLCKLIPENKWIFIEKPLADEGVLFNEDTGKRIFVGYNLRQHGCVKQAKEWVNAGYLGQPLWANFTCGQFNDRPDYHRDGVILNWSHEIDLALYLLGSGHVVSSSTRLNNGQDDLTDIILKHDNGCQTVVHLDYLTRPEIRQFIIVGSEGTIIVELLRHFAWLRSKNDVMLDSVETKDTWDGNYIDEMKAFIDRIDGKETIGCDGNEAREVLKVCLEARKSAGL